MRVLLDECSGQAPGAVLDDGALGDAYAVPASPWLRVNMVASLDGAATGADGRTGSINNAVDKRVFDLLRSTADAVLVGAGTARSEGYRPGGPPIVVVSRSGRVPEQLRGASPGVVVLATTGTAPHGAEARALLGDEHVVVAGEDAVDLAALVRELQERGLRRLLGEGGPALLRDLLAAGVVDELCLTTVPRVLAGGHPRIITGAPLDVRLRPALLLEEHGTVLSRWLVEH